MCPASEIGRYLTITSSYHYYSYGRTVVIRDAQPADQHWAIAYDESQGDDKFYILSYPTLQYALKVGYQSAKDWDSSALVVQAVDISNPYYPVIVNGAPFVDLGDRFYFSFEKTGGDDSRVFIKNVATGLVLEHIDTDPNYPQEAVYAVSKAPVKMGGHCTCSQDKHALGQHWRVSD